MLGLFEVLEKTESLETKEERINFLRSQQSPPLLICLQYTLHPDLQWAIKLPLPKYIANPYPGQETQMLAEAKRLYLFMENSGINLTEQKRTVLLQQLLDMLHVKDIEIFEHMIQKKLPYANITYNLIWEAFPGLLPEPKEEKPVKKESEIKGNKASTVITDEAVETLKKIRKKKTETPVTKEKVQEPKAKKGQKTKTP